MKSLAQEHVRLLNQSRLRLGIGQVKKQLVWTAAASVMGSPVPRSNDDGYALLASFLTTNYVGPVGTIIIQAPQAKVKRRGSRAKTQAETGFAATDAFLQTFEWRRLRMVVLTKRGACCECCGATPPDVRINVDHIKPRRKYPELALVETNLQVLCEVCNHGKGSWDETDWRASGTTRVPLQDSPNRDGDGDEQERNAGADFLRFAASRSKSYSPRLVRRS